MKQTMHILRYKCLYLYADFKKDNSELVHSAFYFQAFCQKNKMEFRYQLYLILKIQNILGFEF